MSLKYRGDEWPVSTACGPFSLQLPMLSLEKQNRMSSFLQLIPNPFSPSYPPNFNFVCVPSPTPLMGGTEYRGLRKTMEHSKRELSKNAPEAGLTKDISVDLGSRLAHWILVDISVNEYIATDTA
ncbi:hypothetical protein STEG23_033615 [Scotinomys teguina]